jgi:pimeloyl-ACP methyl ester carboxylesterase
MNLTTPILAPPPCTTSYVDLPLARLHIMEAGHGAPLIIVPATISELENWRALAQFMAQWFHIYFFELPGHGGSTPFRDPFSSHLVAQLVEQLADRLGYERFSLMGFSFGGILAMRTFKRLSDRIERLALIAPCLDHRALAFSPLRQTLLYRSNRLLMYPRLQAGFYGLVHNERTVPLVARILQRIGHVERSIALKEKLFLTQPSTIAVLNAQINEILTTEFEVEPVKYQAPCYFAMSARDPLLRFDATLEILRKHFERINTLQLDYPFHQPPVPFTYEEYNRDFHHTVDAFVGTSSSRSI